MKIDPKQLDVLSVSIDNLGRLVVEPRLGEDIDLQFIYRAAAEVTWNAEARTLVGGKPRELSAPFPPLRSEPW